MMKENFQVFYLSLKLSSFCFPLVFTTIII